MSKRARKRRRKWRLRLPRNRYGSRLPMLARSAATRSSMSREIQMEHSHEQLCAKFKAAHVGRAVGRRSRIGSAVTNSAGERRDIAPRDERIAYFAQDDENSRA